VNDDSDDEDAAEGGINARNKVALGFIWIVATGYAVMSKEIMSKERFVPCSVRQDLTDRVNVLSLVIAIGIPVLVGPVLCPFMHFVLTMCNLCCHSCLVPKGGLVHSATVEEDRVTGCTCYVLDFGVIASFTAVLLVVYPTHMYITEVYLATIDTHFAFMAFKYCFGCMHLVLLPVAILAIRGDIRQATFDVYFKRTSTTEAAVQRAGNSDNEDNIRDH
jgi:hypothetical protein